MAFQAGVGSFMLRMQIPLFETMYFGLNMRDSDSAEICSTKNRYKYHIRFTQVSWIYKWPYIPDTWWIIATLGDLH